MIRSHRRLRVAAIVLAFGTFPATAPAQASPPSATTSSRDNDVASIDSIIAALYQSISGGIGEKRDWQRLYNLFAPTGRMVPVLRTATGSVLREMTPQEYVSRSGATIEQYGFSEREIARRTETFGSIVHVWSTYDGKFAAAGAPAPPRGINSLQLYHDGSRWWILSLMWEAERPDNPLPPRYLRSDPPG